MGRTTAGQVLAQVDGLLPNAYTREEKMRWLLQAECTLLREVLQPALREELSVPEALEDGTALTAKAPYDRLYGLYVQAQIHYADGDMVRCSNALSLWNEGVAEMQAAALREKGGAQAAKCLRFC